MKINTAGRVAKRFKNEELGIHWRVDDTRESFDRLLYHLDVKTNTKPYFEEALAHLNLNDDRFGEGLVVADIGAGVCWTSAILAKHPKVKLVYAVDPSDTRLKHGRSVVRHFGAENKVRIIHGTFLEPNIPQKPDLIVLCGSFHHCYDNEVDGLFSNMRRLLKPGGEILITGEHYIDRIWILKRFLGYLYHFRDRSKLNYGLKNLRAPHPFGGDHWRVRKEIDRIFRNNGFIPRIFIHKGLLSKDAFPFYRRLGWHYYYAMLKKDKNGGIET